MPKQNSHKKSPFPSPVCAFSDFCGPSLPAPPNNPKPTRNPHQTPASPNLTSYILHLTFFLLAGFAHAQEKTTYQNHILPIFESSCTNCHNPDKKKGGLDLTSYAATLAGGSGGKIADPGDGLSSRLYQSAAHTIEPIMPPKGERLGKKELTLLRAWIDGGLLDSKDSKAKKSDAPKITLTAPSAGKPDGPPPFPKDLLLEPVVTPKSSTVIHAIVRSPWAPLIAVTSQHQVLLYNTNTLDLAGILPFPAGEPIALSFHPSGKFLTVGGGTAGKSGTTITYDITNGDQILTTGKAYDSIIATSLRADMQAIATGSPSKFIKTWNPTDNTQEHSIKKHTDWITALAYSHDGILLASADRNGGLWVWEAHSGNLLHTLRGHQARITSLKWSADSNYLASASEDGTLRTWNMKTGKENKKITAHTPGILAFDWATDGHLITTGRDNRIKHWLPNYTLIKEIKTDALPTTAAFSQDAKKFFIADINGTLTAYDAKTHTPIQTLSTIPATITNRIKTTQTTLTEIDPKIQTATKERDTLKQTLKTQTDAITQKITTLNQQKQKRQKLEIQIKTQNQALQKLNQEITNIDNHRKEIIPQRKSTRDALNQHLTETRKTTQQRDQLQNQFNESQNQLNQLTKQLEQAQQKHQANPENQNLKQQADQLQQQLTQKTSTHADLTAKLEATNNFLEQLTQQTPTHQRTVQDTESKWQATLKPWDQSLKKRTAIHADLKPLHEQKNTLNNTIPPLEKSIPQLTKQRDDLTKQLPQKQSTLTTLQNQKTHLIQKIKNLHAAQINTKRLQAQTHLKTLTQQRNQLLQEFTTLAKQKPTPKTTNQIIILKQKINQTTPQHQTAKTTVNQLETAYKTASQ